MTETILSGPDQIREGDRLRIDGIIVESVGAWTPAVFQHYHHFKGGISLRADLLKTATITRLDPPIKAGGSVSVSQILLVGSARATDADLRLRSVGFDPLRNIFQRPERL